MTLAQGCEGSTDVVNVRTRPRKLRRTEPWSSEGFPSLVLYGTASHNASKQEHLGMVSIMGSTLVQQFGTPASVVKKWHACVVEGYSTTSHPMLDRNVVRKRLLE
ncbi:hypothetical protein PV10_07766 [Exophiala mesophila]|uniref:Uncharacterized protein n=1 Tax=Exophiala mesophila TaxID=212818 RepID=A0A0D1WN50_EXOME|nr:uncharacterized protein PV10_07766 [Exophiala mesophila]KIV90460.1 hypothetical protein PV10_07766 [Exophiala mesophila]